MKEIRIEKTKKGYPAFWEAGGGYSNTGEATIIAGKNGLPKKPIYIRMRGQLANSDHALIPLEVGDFVILADHHRKDFYIEVLEITEFKEDSAIVKPFAIFENGEWDNESVSKVFHAWETGNLESITDIDDEIYHLCQAILAAQEKATCYHCREPHFIVE